MLVVTIKIKLATPVTLNAASHPAPLIPSSPFRPPLLLLPLPPLQCKELELSNPSKKAISYSARLEGHRDFSIESSSIRIEPKATAKLLLRCTPTNTLSQVRPRGRTAREPRRLTRPPALHPDTHLRLRRYHKSRARPLGSGFFVLQLLG